MFITRTMKPNLLSLAKQFPVVALMGPANQASRRLQKKASPTTPTSRLKILINEL